MLRSLRSRAAAYWVAAVLLALLTAAANAALLGRADGLRHAWGDQQAVPVVARPVAAGTRLAATDVKIREVPRALVPAAALAEAPEGRIAAAALVPGEILLAGRLVAENDLPPGTVAVAVARSEVGIELAVGTPVILFPARASMTSGGAAASDATPTRAMVQALSADAVVVVLPAADAARLAPALHDGDIVVARAASG